MTSLRIAIIASSVFAAFSALAQTPPAEERDAAMPQAQTSETPTTPAALPAEPPAEDRNAVMPQAQTSETSATADTSPAEPVSQSKPSEASTARASQFKTVDRLELEGTAITGNRELPKVLYIVPWKKSDLGDMIGRPANSLLDEVLAPVDRDVFKRQTEYFTTLNSDATATSPAPQQGPAPAPPEH